MSTTEQQATPSTGPKPRAVPMTKDSDPELDAHLAAWEAASSKIRRLDCEFQKFVYIPTFEVEKRGQGTIAVERDHRGKYCVVPAAIKPGGVAAKKFKLESCTPECWQWTGPHLLQIDEQHRSYERINVDPNDKSSKVSFFSPTEEQLDLLFLKPFIMGTPADQLKKRFTIRQLRENGQELWLELVPRRQKDADSFEKAVLILDRRSWLPRALKLYDPTGGRTVHIFQNVKVNSEAGDDLSKPNLEGYRRVGSN
jgi:hypothetical protein